jgi:hypothetical protein
MTANPSAHGWSLIGIHALCDTDGNPPIRVDSSGTADAGMAQRWTKVIFADGSSREFESLRGAPWTELFNHTRGESTHG